MKYLALGEQYLYEAQVISSRVKELRDTGAEPRRLAQLREMRTQLRAVGNDLIERGKRYAE